MTLGPCTWKPAGYDGKVKKHVHFAKASYLSCGNFSLIR